MPRPGSSGAARPMGERRNLQPGGIVGWHGQSGSAVWRRIVRDATRHRKTSTALVNSLPVLTTRTRQTDALSVPPSALRQTDALSVPPSVLTTRTRQTDALSVPPSALRQTARLPRRLTPPRNDKGVCAKRVRAGSPRHELPEARLHLFREARERLPRYDACGSERSGLDRNLP